jgi:hypothetical protein
VHLRPVADGVVDRRLTQGMHPRANARESVRCLPTKVYIKQDIADPYPLILDGQGLMDFYAFALECTPTPRCPSRSGSIPAARQYFLTSRHGILRSRCRRTNPFPSAPSLTAAENEGQWSYASRA